jgi:hypothetical protein
MQEAFKHIDIQKHGHRTAYVNPVASPLDIGTNRAPSRKLIAASGEVQSVLASSSAAAQELATNGQSLADSDEWRA